MKMRGRRYWRHACARESVAAAAGMDAIDRALLAAWVGKRDGAGAEKVFGRVTGPAGAGATYQRPVRSWSLVIRANDKRLRFHRIRRGEEDLEGRPIPRPRLRSKDPVPPSAAPPPRALEGDWLGVHLDAEVVGRLCAPVDLPWPGLTIAEAAARFGVETTTIYRWSKPRGRERAAMTTLFAEARARERFESGPDAWLDAPPPRWDGRGRRPRGSLAEQMREKVAEIMRDRPVQRVRGKVLTIDRYVNRADRKRDDLRVWSPTPVDPGGRIVSGPWGGLNRRLHERVPADWLQLLRGRRGKQCWGWSCPRCEAWVYKLYWPARVTTLGMVVGSPWAHRAWEEHGALVGEGFVCRRCAKLMYESTERTSRPEPGRTVDPWDRFVKRISGGVLRGGEVVVPKENES